MKNVEQLFSSKIFSKLKSFFKICIASLDKFVIYFLAREMSKFLFVCDREKNLGSQSP